jgi:D-ribulokinase
MDYGLGIDFGTSGARAIVLDGDRQIQTQVAVALPPPNRPALWRSTLFDLIEQIPLAQRQRLGAIAINGTSSTVLIADAQGTPLSDVLMYNDDRAATPHRPQRHLQPRQTPLAPTTARILSGPLFSASGGLDRGIAPWTMGGERLSQCVKVGL